MNMNMQVENTATNVHWFVYKKLTFKILRLYSVCHIEYGRACVSMKT